MDLFSAYLSPFFTVDKAHCSMVNYYDEIEIEDFAWDPIAKVFHYPCPCGDRFEVSKPQLRDGDEVATCPSCSLIVRVIYDYVSSGPPARILSLTSMQLDWEDYTSDDDEGVSTETTATSTSHSPSSPAKAGSDLTGAVSPSSATQISSG